MEIEMNVNLKCFSTLVNPDSCDYKESQTYRLTQGQTVGDLVDQAGIEKDDVKIAFVNSKIVDCHEIEEANPNHEGYFSFFLHLRMLSKCQKI